MKNQNIFEYNFPKFNNEYNFYVNSTNKESFNGILLNDHQFLYLYGPKKSGKTSIGDIWLKKNLAKNYNSNFEILIKNKDNILIDNLNSEFNEEELFHLMNHCKLNNLKILVISNHNINELNFLLNDLNSRLKTFFYYKINKPDDDMLLNIMTKFFIEKQFIINSHDIFQYILKRANRSYEEILSIVEKLDRLSLEKKRQLTIPLVKEIL